MDTGYHGNYLAYLFRRYVLFHGIWVQENDGLGISRHRVNNPDSSRHPLLFALLRFINANWDLGIGCDVRPSRKNEL